jgi:hypothetical protein
MITLTQFETRSVDAQAAYTWQCGNYLMSRLTAESIVDLFNVGDFYVEVTLDAHLHYVHRVSSFKTYSSLDAGYLDTVSLRDLATDRLPGIGQVKENATPPNTSLPLVS